MKSPKRKLPFWILVAVAAMAAGVFYLVIGLAPADRGTPPDEAVESVRVVEADDDSLSGLAPQIPGTSKTTDVSDENLHLFERLAFDLRAEDDPQLRQRHLNDFFAFLATMEPEEAAELLLAYLDSGQDFVVGMPFQVGKGGILRSHPTLRAAALDWLGEINPGQAKLYSRKIFEDFQSADEWALALRNYGRLTEPGTDLYYAERIREMISHEEWRKAPTGGYAEAFDAVIHNQQVDLVADLYEIYQQEDNLSRLGNVVLDNFARAHPEEVLPVLLSQTADRYPETSRLRATMFGRVDPRSPRQLHLLEDYLSDDRISNEEKRIFIEYFPHFSGFVGQRLLSGNSVRPLAEQARIDRAAIEVLSMWTQRGILADFEEKIKEKIEWLDAGLKTVE